MPSEIRTRKKKNKTLGEETTYHWRDGSRKYPLSLSFLRIRQLPSVKCEGETRVSYIYKKIVHTHTHTHTHHIFTWSKGKDISVYFLFLTFSYGWNLMIYGFFIIWFIFSIFVFGLLDWVGSQRVKINTDVELPACLPASVEKIY
jgi:hypothetical protein